MLFGKAMWFRIFTKCFELRFLSTNLEHLWLISKPLLEMFSTPYMFYLIWPSHWYHICAIWTDKMRTKNCTRWSLGDCHFGILWKIKFLKTCSTSCGLISDGSCFKNQSSNPKRKAQNVHWSQNRAKHNLYLFTIFVWINPMRYIQTLALIQTNYPNLNEASMRVKTSTFHLHREMTNLESHFDTKIHFFKTHSPINIFAIFFHILHPYTKHNLLYALIHLCVHHFTLSKS